MHSKEIRNMLLLSFNNELITMDEFVLLYDANSSRNLIFLHTKYSRFNLNDMDDTKCINEFRFRKMDIPRLADALALPATFHCHQRSKAGRIEGLCMLLKKLTYPSRLSDMVSVRPICLPEDHQKLVYNGHKRVDALKFQSLAIPTVLVAHLFGPVGR